MGRISHVLETTLAKKALMALSGILLFGFVVAHMAGNLKMFLGAEKMNHYAAWLREIGYPALPHGVALWIMRVVLLAAVAVHVWAAVSLTLTNRRARPHAYQLRRGVQLDYASRTMRWSGFLILAYVVYHLMHITFGNLHSDFIPGDPYHNLVVAFQQWPVALTYVVANVLLGVHLYHGLWSMFQSLGLDHPAYRNLRRPFAVAFAVVVTLGFISVPISVMAGFIGIEGGA